jgi:hypothetical protein
MLRERLETPSARPLFQGTGGLLAPSGDDRLDLASVAASVQRKLGASADPARVDAVLALLAAELVPAARVRQYLPVILQRKACDRLRAEAALSRPQA